MKRAFLYLLVGAVAGIVTFVITEPTAARGMNTDAEAARHGTVLAFTIGTLLIGLLGLLSGFLQGSRTHVLKGLFAGIFVGLFCGPLALSIGNTVFGVLGGQNASIFSRVPGWAFFGMVLGCGVALTEATIVRSASRTYSAILGGLAGGALGGFLFEGAAAMFGQSIAQPQGSGDVGGPSRAVGFFSLCAVIGLFIGVAQALSTRAKLRLVFGRNEFKEWPVDGSQTTIGRAENASIPVFADPNLAPLHATIVRYQGRFIIHDAGTSVGVGVNGARVQQAELRHGDTIQMASLTFQFLLAGMASVAAPTPQRAPEPRPQTHAPAEPQVPTMTTAMPAVSAVMARVVMMNGPLAGNMFPIQGPTEIGREGIGIRVDHDSAISRRHALLEPAPHGLVLHDLQSRNGVSVNGTRINQPTLLHVGDQFQIGSTIFRVE